MNVTRSEIDIFLNDIKKLIKSKKKYFILSNRDINNKFCYEYSLSSKFIMDIINKLTIRDFAKIMNNEHELYDEKLYLFAPILNLVNSFGKSENIQIYLKVNYIKECNTLVVVSLHRCNYKLKYAFR